MTAPAPEPPLFTFTSTHQVMVAEDLLRAEGFWLQVLPAPPRPGILCGLALRLHPEDLEAARTVLRRHAITWAETRPGREG